MADTLELVELKKSLVAAVKKNDTARARDILDALAGATISLEVLQSTKIGKIVGRLRANEDGEISQRAHKLVHKWKSVIGLASNTDSVTPTETCAKSVETPAQSTAKSDSPAAENSPKPNGAQEKKSTNGKPPTSSTAKRKPSAPSSPPPSSPQSTDALRAKTISMLAEALGHNGEDPDGPAQEIAQAIEAELHNIYGSTNTEYKAKFRCLFMNLKDPNNPDLRGSVLARDITVAELCRMTPQQMASKEMQQLRKNIEEQYKKAALLSDTQQATTDMFRCSKCKQRKCSYFPLQTRSADEPMTIFVTCTVCNHRWKC